MKKEKIKDILEFIIGFIMVAIITAILGTILVKFFGIRYFPGIPTEYY